MIGRYPFDHDFFFEPSFIDFRRPEFNLNHNNTLDVYNPKTDFVETDKSFNIKLDLPGIEKSHIDIDLSPKNILTVSAERKVDEKKKEEKWHIHERSYAKYSRSFKLPYTIDPNSIHANFENGVLAIDIAKSTQPEPETKKIAIN